MTFLVRSLLALLFALVALGCGRYYDIGSPHGARGQFAVWVPPQPNPWGWGWSSGGFVCRDCPVGPEPTTNWASPDVGTPGPSLPRSERDHVTEGTALTNFDQVAARRALAEVDLASCRDVAPVGGGHARVTFASDGRVSKVVLDASSGLSEPAIECVGSHLGAATVPAFRGSPVTVGTQYRVR